LLGIGLWLFINGAWSVKGYIDIQKDWFYDLNASLTQYPTWHYNLTQFGDAFIFLSLLTLLIIFRSVIWENLVSASLFSALFSRLLKAIFAVPRPAAILDNDSFEIVGKTLAGAKNSLPSGHAITVFTVLTILWIGFMPKKMTHKIAWGLALLILGLILAFTRVGIGAHFPLDVVIGSIVGYLSGLTGILFNQRYKLWSWLGNKKYLPLLMVLMVISLVVIASKIFKESLPIFYIAGLSLLVSLYKMIKLYVQK
jgi:membrane-associated phospholipid phosphatase